MKDCTGPIVKSKKAGIVFLSSYFKADVIAEV